MAITKKAKKLNAINLKKDAKVLDEKLQTIVVSNVNGDEYELTIDKVFKKSKIILLNAQLLDTAQYASLHNIDFTLIFERFTFLMIIKHFTSFGESMPKKINEQIALIEKLDDMGLFEPIIDAMPQSEIEKVLMSIQENVDTYTERLNQAEIALNDFNDAASNMIDLEENESE